MKKKRPLLSRIAVEEGPFSAAGKFFLRENRRGDKKPTGPPGFLGYCAWHECACALAGGRRKAGALFSELCV